MLTRIGNIRPPASTAKLSPPADKAPRYAQASRRRQLSSRVRWWLLRQVIHPGDPARDAEVRAWRLLQVQSCTAAADTLPHDTVILDGELPAARLAGEVLEILGRDTRFAI